jgi:hypothetical protein
MMNPFLDRDAMRQLLAALTAACDDIRHGKGESPMLEELLRAHGGGLDLLGSYRVKVSAPKLPTTRQDFDAMLNDTVEAALTWANMRANSAVVYAIFLFSQLALDAEECGLDIDNFLQRAALELAGSDGEP